MSIFIKVNELLNEDNWFRAEQGGEMPTPNVNYCLWTALHTVCLAENRNSLDYADLLQRAITAVDPGWEAEFPPTMVELAPVFRWNDAQTDFQRIQQVIDAAITLESS